MTVIPSRRLEFTDLPGRASADPFEALMANSSVRVVQLDRTPGRKAHRHPESEEIIYVVAGRGEVWIDGQTEAVAEGDVIRIPPGAAHATIPAVDSAMRLVCFFPHPDLSTNLDDTNIEVI